MNIKIEAKQGVDDQRPDVDGQGQASTSGVEGQAALELKGGATAKLEASGITEVKGSLVKIN